MSEKTITHASFISDSNHEAAANQAATFANQLGDRLITISHSYSGTQTAVIVWYHTYLPVKRDATPPVEIRSYTDDELHQLSSEVSHDITQGNTLRIRWNNIAMGMAIRTINDLKKVPSKACPCHWTTPCNPNCSCINPNSSHGCACCCTYGNEAQRKIAAQRIAAALFLTGRE